MKKYLRFLVPMGMLEGFLWIAIHLPDNFSPFIPFIVVNIVLGMVILAILVIVSLLWAIDNFWR